MSILDVSFQNASHVWMRNITVYRKTYKINLLPNFFEPVIYLVAMGIGLGAYITKQMEGVSYLQFIAPGLIMSNAMNGATFETTYNTFVKMHFGKIYKAITATPVNMRDAMLGEVLWAVTRGTIYGVIFAVVVTAFGLVPGWVSLFLLPLFLFGGIFFPVGGFPFWARILAWCTPLYHCVNLAKGVVLGTWSVGHWGDLAWIVVVTVLLITVSIRRVEKKLAV